MLDRMLHERIAALDIGLFDHVHSQTETDDRRSLLAIHDAVAERGSFSYLEIGSYMGGSLQVAIADPRCTRIVSVDSRPFAPPDVRGGYRPYPDNSTRRMLDNLAQVPGADLSKVETIEASSEDIDPASLERPDLCFIDAEHTNEAVLRDAQFCHDVLRGRGIIAFHDSALLEKGILRFLQAIGRPRRAYPLRFSVFVVELGDVPSLLSRESIRGLLQRPRPAWVAANRLRADDKLWAVNIERRRVQQARTTRRAAAQ